MAKRRIIQIVWTPPSFPLDEKFDRDKFKLYAEDGFLKLRTSDGDLVRVIPAHALQLVQFGEVEDDVPALSPSPAPMPRPMGVPSEDPTEEIPAHLPEKAPEVS